MFDKKEHLKAYHRAYYQTHKEYWREKNKKRSILHCEELRKHHQQYYLIHKKHFKELADKWRATHREQQREYWKKHRLEHKESIRKAQKKWSVKNKEHIDEHNKQYRKTPKGERVYMKVAAKRRQLGFVPLNKRFSGSAGHHIDKKRVIFIPKKIHGSISHDLFANKNMDKINTIAYEFLRNGGAGQ